MRISAGRPHGGEALAPSRTMRPLSFETRFALLRMRKTSVQLLDRHGDALADADAHGGERAFASALLHAMHGCDDKPRAAHAERMAERNRAAMRIDEVGILRNAELAQTGNTLAGESFIELDQIEIADLQSEPFHQLLRRRHRTNAHDARRHAGGGKAKNARTWRQAVLLHSRF